MSPNPTRLPSVMKPEDVDRNRSLSCAEYDDCLDAATRRAWRSWSCGRCGLFSHAREARAAETAHLATLQPQA